LTLIAGALGGEMEGSLLLATIAGVLFNFLTTGRFVFNSAGWRPLGRSIAAYGTINLTNLAILDVLGIGGMGAIAAQGAAALPVIVPLAFAILKWFVFKRRGGPMINVVARVIMKKRFHDHYVAGGLPMKMLCLPPFLELAHQLDTSGLGIRKYGLASKAATGSLYQHKSPVGDSRTVAF
jgi:putative flippase GtrA